MAGSSLGSVPACARCTFQLAEASDDMAHKDSRNLSPHSPTSTWMHFFYKRREEKKEEECSVCSRQKIHCAVKLYIHIRNSKPIASESRILVTVNKITLPTILSFCPHKKRKKAFNSTFLQESYSSWWIPVFLQGHPISAIRELWSPGSSVAH